MPQVFQVLKCYKCSTFQVHQTKKSNKFQCKMCGEKQSIKRHYGLGNGQECREHVQKLNGLRGEIQENKNNVDSLSENSSEEDTTPSIQCTQRETKSKWSDFVDTEVAIDENIGNDPMYLNNTEVVLELPKKCQKTLGRFEKRHKAWASSNKSDSDDANNENVLKSPSKKSCVVNNFTNQKIGDRQTTVEFGNAQSKSFNIKAKTEKSFNSLNIHLKQENIGSVKQERPFFNNSKIIESKWTHEINRDTAPREQNLFYPLDTPGKVSKTKFVPPLINKNSKWAKFAENDDINIISENDEEQSDSVNFIEPIKYNNSIPQKLTSVNSTNEHHFHNDHKRLFSLSNDDDLDDYLDI